jgi:RND family efflux transporter MFP subunit
MFMNKNVIKNLTIALVIAAILLGIWWLYTLVNTTENTTNNSQEANINGTTDTTVSQSTKAALTVNLVKPSRTLMNQNITANGSISPWQEAVIGSESSGLMLAQVLVNVGDKVKRGQLLAEFSTATIAADIAQAQANLAEAKANAIEANGNASRARSIQETGALSMQQIEQLIALDATSKARVAAAEATLQSQQIKMKQTKVYAPDSGIISSRAATVGAVVSPGQELFKLIRQGRLEWRAELTSSKIGAIKQGLNANLTMPSGEQVVGKVRMVSPMVDTQTRNAMVFVDLPANNQIKSGMFARGSFEIGENESVTLPASALVLRDGFAYLMQIDNQNQSDKQIHVKQIKVQMGKRVGDMVEIMGLENSMNHDFVAKGGAFLADGDAVNVVGNTAPLEIKP